MRQNDNKRQNKNRLPLFREQESLSEAVERSNILRFIAEELRQDSQELRRASQELRRKAKESRREAARVRQALQERKEQERRERERTNVEE